MFSWFDNLRIGAKLIVVLSAVLALTVLVGAISVVQLDRLSGDAQQLAGTALPRVRVVAAIRTTVLELRVQQYAHMLSDSEQEQAQMKLQIKALAARVADLRRQYEPMISSAEERAAYESFGRAWDAYMQRNAQVLLLTGDFGTQAMGGDYRKAFDAMTGSLSSILKLNDVAIDELSHATQATAGQTRIVIFGAVGAAVAVGVLLAMVMARRIAGSLELAAARARDVAKGDLTRAIPEGGHDEVGRLLGALREMQDGLRSLVSTVRSGVESVAASSADIASGNMNLSTRTEQQSGNLQQTVAAIHEMASHVRRSMESAQQANQLARSASAVAQRGGGAVQEVVRTMGDISEASRKITDIIGVIDGIAFQTNILALNAAVEAARAGEQGRGFAVVAGEVRALAQRSAQATHEIKGLIGASAEKVELGARLVQDAGNTMEELVGSVRRVGDIIGEISSAASEQTTGIDQINDAVTQLDVMTQQNAALVEQSAAAAESLREQGSRLNVAVARFHLA